MSIPVIILCIFGGLTLLGLVFVGLLIWIGRGESDVNGDPERDAGYASEEIDDMERRLYPTAITPAERQLMRQRRPNPTISDDYSDRAHAAVVIGRI